MANMNMIIHDMEGEIEIGDTFKQSQVPQRQPPPDLRPRRRQSDVEPGLVQGEGLRRRRAGPLPERRRLPRQQGRLGLGAAHPRVPE